MPEVRVDEAYADAPLHTKTDGAGASIYCFLTVRDRLVSESVKDVPPPSSTAPSADSVG